MRTYFLFILVILSSLAHADPIRLTTAQGTVEIGTEPSCKASNGDEIKDGDSVRTGKDSSPLSPIPVALS